VSERCAPFSKRGFQAMVERASRAAGFDRKIHPHMLRHSCGYKLADDHPAALSNRLLGPDCFWDYLLAESAARRHADLLRIGHAVPCAVAMPKSKLS